MGSVLVEAMAQGSIGEPSSKQLHPFFTKAAAAPAASAPSLVAEDDGHGHSTSGLKEDDEEGRKRRNADPTSNDEPEVKKQRCQTRINAPASNGSIIDHFTKPNQGPSTPPQITNEDENPQSVTPLTTGQATGNHSASAVPTESTWDVSKQEAPSVSTPDPSKKVLKLNPKTGTLRSPPKPKPQPKPSKIVCIKYGRDEDHRKALGEKVMQVLEGTLKFSMPPSETRKKPGRKPRDTSSNQMATAANKHPFFASKQKAPTGQGAVEDAPKKTSAKTSIFMSTPVSPRKPRAVADWTKVAPLGNKSSGLRIPGGKYPLWPPKDMCHVRGDENDPPRMSISSTNIYATKKSKGQITSVMPQEYVIDHLVNQLRVDVVRNSLPRDDDSFLPAPAELRLPKRHFESGRKLQQRVRKELRTYYFDNVYSDLDSSQDESLVSRRRKTTHPAIARLYDSLATNLSAYDMSCCESVAWTQKYSPARGSEVLQAGKEGLLLKEWLEALKVQSVGTGASGSSTKTKSKSDEAPKKRRKKNKLDGFIVDSEEEANEMTEVSDDEGAWAPAGPGTPLKTIVRSVNAKPQVRPANTVLISGPHGSGKTAAVYAVAKELGFEIFEIHAGSRRSGKDILEKVGDMTRNHLVQQHRAQQPEAQADTENSKSGKQGTMMSFFKPKSGAAQKKAPQTAQPEQKPTLEAKSSTPKAQKQSLILLEEVDILFEEDKQFWTTLTDMIVQSKRPFIMTCSDETLPQTQSLRLHGIFRFSPPPIDLAVDLCLLIAANEGHALQRSSVQALYESRGNDLRATITELNYWCQIGVGDRKGGFDWFYLRWPKGSDLDENGDVVRVVSEDTYSKGMGWVSRDPLVVGQDYLDIELEAFHQSWEAWGLDMEDWRDPRGVEAWAAQSTKASAQAPARLTDLAAYGEFCDSMSAADICSNGFTAIEFEEQIDPTLPDLPTKAKDDFITGRILLEADPVVWQSSPHVDISMALNSLAKSRLGNAQSGDGDTAKVVKPIDEGRIMASIESSIRTSSDAINRLDIAYAFDPIAVSAKATAASYLDPSVFDQTMRLIVLDVAPWVRGIVAYDQRLMNERMKLSNLLSEGGKRKRMRKTRAAYSALEGGERGSTRKESYFGDCLNTGYVMKTGGRDWQDALPEPRPAEEEHSVPASSPMSEASLV